MPEWSRDDPGAGDTDALTRCAARMDELVHTLTVNAANVRDATAEIAPQVWQGVAGSAFRDRAISVSADLGLFVRSISEYAPALSTYASQVQSIDDEFRHLDRQRESWLDAQTTARSEIRQGVTDLTGADQARLLRARTDLTEATARLRTIEAQIDDLADERRTADTALAAALSHGPSTAFTATGSALVTSGVTRPQDFSDQQMLHALLSLADSVLAGGDAEQIAAFAALLSRLGSDPAVSSQLFQTLGGAGTADLLARLDRAAADPATAPAATTALDAMRRALSTASTQWDPTWSNTFVTDLLAAPIGPLSIAYLFGDQTRAPMSANLAFATAEALHAWEAEHGSPCTWLIDACTTPTGMAASIRTGQTMDAGLLRADPADSVFRTMALYPTQSLDWFTDPDHGSARIDYWYGQRDWNAAVGFAGPLLVWEATQAVPGALVGDGMDLARVGQLATMNDQVIKAWAFNEQVPISGLSEDARLALAGVVAAQLPLWLESTIISDNGVSTGTILDEDMLVDWLGIRVPAAEVGRDTFSQMLAEITTSPHASGRLLVGTEDLLARLATSIDPANPSSCDMALRRCAALLGWVDSGHLANDLSVAARKDATINTVIDLTGLAVGTATSGFGSSVLTYGAESAASSLLATHVPTLLEQTWTSTGEVGERRALAQETLRTIIEDTVGADTVQAHQGEDIDDYLDELTVDYGAGLFHPSSVSSVS